VGRVAKELKFVACAHLSLRALSSVLMSRTPIGADKSSRGPQAGLAWLPPRHILSFILTMIFSSSSPPPVVVARGHGTVCTQG
jgi:hypothetical protein